jgi:hypothetical protein
LESCRGTPLPLDLRGAIRGHARAPRRKLATVPRKPAGDTATDGYTPLQGQYLAFIYAYTTLHRRPPAEADMQAFFRVTSLRSPDGSAARTAWPDPPHSRSGSVDRATRRPFPPALP